MTIPEVVMTGGATPGIQADESHARDVAALFAAAQSAPNDVVVRTAYRALERQSDAAFAYFTQGDPRWRVHVVFTRTAAPYNSDQEMIAAVRESRRLELVTSATEPDRVHPLLGCERGGAYDRFRAVHDIAGHVWPGLGFDPDGELGAWLVQERWYAGLARLALGTELHGEFSVRWTTGQIADHKAMLFDTQLLARGRRGTASFVPRQVHKST